MRWVMAAACAAAVWFAFAPAADAKGCIKGAIVGGVAGHMAGHGKMGAAAGCVVGRHEANKADANKANAQAPSGENQRRRVPSIDRTAVRSIGMADLSA